MVSKNHPANEVVIVSKNHPADERANEVMISKKYFFIEDQRDDGLKRKIFFYRRVSEVMVSKKYFFIEGPAR